LEVGIGISLTRASDNPKVGSSTTEKLSPQPRVKILLHSFETAKDN